MNPESIKSDLRAALVVFLVALPLCLGIALASGASAFSGIIAGVVGGIVVGALSGSRLSVSGPAAGLTIVVLDAINTMGSFEAFLAALVLCGLLQILLGVLKAGVLASYFPTAVIKGMLAAIGLILIFKQIPHALGYDFDYTGDENFQEKDGHNTFSDIGYAMMEPEPLAVVASVVGLLIMIFWDSRKMAFFRLIPGALIAVLTGVLLQEMALLFFPKHALEPIHLVNLPTGMLSGEASSLFVSPDWSAFMNPELYQVAITLALIASIESLLSVEAIDKLDPKYEITPSNRELVAQGSGNLVSALLGGIPVTAVIVRSSANLLAGAQTKMAAIFHGIFIIIAVAFIPQIINLIPLASLAAILLVVGFKLTKPSLIMEQLRKSPNQYIPFLVTIVAIVLSDLLTGIAIGLAVGFAFILRSNLKKSIVMVQDGPNYLIRLRHNVSFINKSLLRSYLASVKPGSFVIIDGTAASFVDDDIIDTIENFRKMSITRQIEVEIKSGTGSMHPYFRKTT